MYLGGFMRGEIQRDTGDWDIDVPADDSCFFWAAALAFLLPVRTDTGTLDGRLNKLFGDLSAEQMQDVVRLIQIYQPGVNEEIFSDKIMRTLVREVFRSRVMDHMASHKDDYSEFYFEEDAGRSFDDYIAYMYDVNSWAGNHEFRALADFLGCAVSEKISDQRFNRKCDVKIELVHVNRSHYKYILSDAAHNAIFGANPALRTPASALGAVSADLDRETRRKNDLENLMYIDSWLSSPGNFDPITLSVIGILLHKMTWKNEDPDLIRNKHGYRNKSNSNAINKTGAKIDFFTLANLPLLVSDKRFWLLLDCNNGQVCNLVKASLDNLKEQIIFILTENAPDQESISSGGGSKEEMITRNYLHRVCAYYHDRVAIEKMLFHLEIINAHTLANMSDDESRYALIYNFFQLGELAKEMSDYVTGYDSNSETPFLILFKALSQYRQAPKDKPECYSANRNNVLSQMLIWLQRSYIDLKIILIALKDYLEQMFDSIAVRYSIDSLDSDWIDDQIPMVVEMLDAGIEGFSTSYDKRKNDTKLLSCEIEKSELDMKNSNSRKIDLKKQYDELDSQIDDKRNVECAKLSKKLTRILEAYSNECCKNDSKKDFEITLSAIFSMKSEKGSNKLRAFKIQIKNFFREDDDKKSSPKKIDCKKNCDMLTEYLRLGDSKCLDALKISDLYEMLKREQAGRSENYDNSTDQNRVMELQKIKERIQYTEQKIIAHKNRLHELENKRMQAEDLLSRKDRIIEILKSETPNLLMDSLDVLSLDVVNNNNTPNKKDDSTEAFKRKAIHLIKRICDEIHQILNNADISLESDCVRASVAFIGIYCNKLKKPREKFPMINFYINTILEKSANKAIYVRAMHIMHDIFHQDDAQVQKAIKNHLLPCKEDFEALLTVLEATADPRLRAQALVRLGLEDEALEILQTELNKVRTIEKNRPYKLSLIEFMLDACMQKSDFMRGLSLVEEGMRYLEELHQIYLKGMPLSMQAARSRFTIIIEDFDLLFHIHYYQILKNVGRSECAKVLFDLSEYFEHGATLIEKKPNLYIKSQIAYLDTLHSDPDSFENCYSKIVDFLEIQNHLHKKILYEFHLKHLMYRHVKLRFTSEKQKLFSDELSTFYRDKKSDFKNIAGERFLEYQFIVNTADFEQAIDNDLCKAREMLISLDRDLGGVKDIIAIDTFHLAKIKFFIKCGKSMKHNVQKLLIEHIQFHVTNKVTHYVTDILLNYMLATYNDQKSPFTKTLLNFTIDQAIKLCRDLSDVDRKLLQSKIVISEAFNSQRLSASQPKKVAIDIGSVVQFSIGKNRVSGEVVEIKNGTLKISFDCDSLTLLRRINGRQQVSHMTIHASVVSEPTQAIEQYYECKGLRYYLILKIDSQERMSEKYLTPLVEYRKIS